MGLVFNAGTEREVTVSQYVIGSFRERGHTQSWEQCCWLIDQAVPFDLMPLFRIFKANNSQNKFPLFKRTDDVVYGIYIQQLNDVYTISSALISGSSATALDEITRFPITGIPSSFPVYFLYRNSEQTGITSVIQGFINKVQECYCELTTLDDLEYVYGNYTSSWKPLNQYNYYPGATIPVPYGIGDVSQDSDLWGVVPSQTWQPDSSNPAGFFQGFSSSDLDLEDLKSSDGSDPDPYRPEQPFDPSDPDPYNPGGDDSSDEIPIPDDPPIGVTNVGFINVYKTATSALQGLGDILFPNVASATDIVDAVVKLCQTLANQNLINYVIDCHVIPVSPVTGGSEHIKVGYRDTNISAPKVTSDYVNVSCGSLNIREYFSGYQDYMATLSKIYLPFIGFVDTKPEYWQNGTISIDYKFNIIDGSFMTYIRSTSSKSELSNSVIAQYSGNACMHFPITGVNYSNMVSGIIGAAAQAIIPGGGAAAVLGGASSALNAMHSGGNVQQSNGYNSTSAILGIRKPFMIIERPVAAFPKNYAHDKGFPANITTLLSNITGFTVIEDIDLSGIPLTDTELTELRSLLADGVYF